MKYYKIVLFFCEVKEIKKNGNPDICLLPFVSCKKKKNRAVSMNVLFAIS